MRGDRTINEAEAAVIRRIFTDYAAGKSPKRIATELNRAGVPGPTGGDWGFSTIIGNPKRGTGILNNEIYIGRLVWNRQRFIKDPDTGKRQARMNPESEWVRQQVLELRIIDDALGEQAKVRQTAIKRPRGADDDTALNQFRDRTRPKYLLSGMTRCGCCGGGYSMISADLLGCSTARNKGTCNNRLNIRRDRLEKRVLDALRHHLMDPALFAEFCDEFTREMNRLRIEAGASIDAARAEIRKIDRDLDMLVNMILKGGAADRINYKMVALERRKKELESFLSTATEPPPLLHPEMATFYRARVGELHMALQADAESQRLAASEALRALIDTIVLTPENGELKVDVRGDLAGILRIATNAKTPGAFASGVSQFELVAGTGFEPVTFRL